MSDSVERDIDLMDGLFAYDTGCASSGIKDEAAKERFKSDAEYSFKVGSLLIKRYMNNDSYELEDAKSFINWFETELEFDV